MEEIFFIELETASVEETFIDFPVVAVDFGLIEDGGKVLTLVIVFDGTFVDGPETFTGDGEDATFEFDFNESLGPLFLFGAEGALFEESVSDLLRDTPILADELFDVCMPTRSPTTGGDLLLLALEDAELELVACFVTLGLALSLADALLGAEMVILFPAAGEVRELGDGELGFLLLLEDAGEDNEEAPLLLLEEGDRFRTLVEGAGLLVALR